MSVLSLGEFLKICTDFDILHRFVESGMILREDVKDICVRAYKLVADGARNIDFSGFKRALYQALSFDFYRSHEITSRNAHSRTMSLDPTT